MRYAPYAGGILICSHSERNTGLAIPMGPGAGGRTNDVQNMRMRRVPLYGGYGML